VESLLIEKPDNPIGFIVEFLQKKYPDQVCEKTLVGSEVSNRADLLKKTEDSFDEDDLDQEEDSESRALETSIKLARAKKRKAVCSEVALDDQDEIAEFEKAPDAKLRILQVLQEHFLFRHLEQEQRELVTKAMSKVVLKRGEIAFKQGEDGDHFYVVDKGSVACFERRDGSEHETLVHTYNPGGTFGDLSIMYNTPRAATCRATTESRLYALPRKAFKVIVMKTTIEKRLHIKSLLQNVEIFKELKDHEFSKLADAMQEEAYEEGDVICRQGDVGSSFFIIKQGTATCIQADPHGNQQEVAQLTTGDYFGENALLASKPRQGTVKATGKNGTLKLLYVERTTFNRILGSIEDILRRNQAAYNKFWAAQI